MSLFDYETQMANTIRLRLPQRTAQLTAQYIQDYDLVWNGKAPSGPGQLPAKAPANYDPAKTWAALGTDGVVVKRGAEGLAAIINSAKSGSVPAGPPAGYTLTENTDGSVTCTKAA